MWDMNPDEPHPARDLPEVERVAYLTAVASLAYADSHLAVGEIETVRKLAEHLGLSGSTADEAVTAAQDPEKIEAIVARFRTSAHRYFLLADAILVVFADGKVVPTETEAIANMASALDINIAQAALLGRYVEGVLHGAGDEDHTLSHALAEGLAEADNHVHPPRGVRWLFRKLTEHKKPGPGPGPG
jgi:uncharacterized tellurite resistance protein B-like protein